MKQFENDLTNGSVFKQLVWFSIPVADVTELTIAGIFYASGVWKKLVIR